MQNRWYDVDPVISLAVTMVYESDKTTQDQCARYIIEQARSTGVALDEQSVNEKYNCFWQRAQDGSNKLFEAMEYFKLAEFDSKKEISLGVINYINNLENSIK